MGRRSDPRTQQRKGRLAVAGMRLLSRLPAPAAYGVANTAAAVGARLPLPLKRVIRTNLEICFPDLPPEELNRLVRRSLAEAAKAGYDMAAAWHRPDEALGRLRRFAGEVEALNRTVADRTPVVLLVPHLGCWEIANYWLSRTYDFHAMFKPSPMPPLDDLVLRSRQRFGSTMYPATPKGVAGIVRALKAGGVTAILPDQVPARGSGRFVPFFGRPAWTGTLAPKLIQQSGARAFMLFVRRLPDRTFELVVRDPDPDLYSDDLDVSLAGLNRSIEALIREEPSQYLWSYRRFRRQPEGMPKVYA